MKILGVVGGLSTETCVSRMLFNELLEKLSARYPGAEVEVLDLAKTPIPHWGDRQVDAAFTPAEQRRPDQASALKLSDGLCQQLLSAEILVVATPMWNFSVPSALKAWVDHVVRVGVTFRMEATGSVGLLHRLRHAYVIESSGGDYRSAEARSLNHVAPYLEGVLRFLGVPSIRTFSAQGTVFDRKEAIRSVQEQLEREIAGAYPTG